VRSWPARKWSGLWPSRKLVLQSEAARDFPLIRGTAGACNRATYAQKRGHPKVGTKLSVNMPPSGMKEKNVCSGAVGGVYAGADWPIRKTDCEGGDGRESSCRQRTAQSEDVERKRET